MSTQALVVGGKPKAVAPVRKQVVRRKRRKVNLAFVLSGLIALMLLSVTMTMIIQAFGSSDTVTADGETEAVTIQPNSVSDKTELDALAVPLVYEGGKTEQTEKVEEKVEVPFYTQREVELLAKTVWGESLVTRSDTQMSAVIWCILNRVDSTGYGCGHGIEYVITFPNQFAGYRESNPVTEHIESLVKDVLERWNAEKHGAVNVGRTLPSDYLWFDGDGKTNTFRNEYDRSTAQYWDWSAISPYEN